MENKIVFALRWRDVFKGLKKYFLSWLCVAVAVAVVISVFACFAGGSDRTVNSVVNFSYDGIEMGVDPLGNKFSPYDIKDEAVVRSALEEVGVEVTDENVSKVQQCITIDGIMPGNVISNITDYSVMMSNGTISSQNKVNDTSYYPTQYRLNFRYGGAGFSRGTACDILNAVTKKYGEVFRSKYGYNEEMEKAVLAVDYNEYDYTAAADVFDSYLDSLQGYIETLSNLDNTRFRSSVTGYSFSDLADAIESMRTEKLDWILSYVVSNNISKDSKALASYYDYKIKDAERYRDAYKEQLTSLESTIRSYEKTNTVVLGVGQESEEYSYSQSSETYDKLINDKIELQKKVSEQEEEMELYKTRLTSINSKTAVDARSEEVEKDFDDFYASIEDLVSSIHDTATDFFDNVWLNNAYSVVTEASNSPFVFVRYIKEQIHIIIAAELITIALYMILVFCYGVAAASGRNFPVPAIGSRKKAEKNRKNEKNNK